MRVVAEESWAWMLFENDGTLYLSALCGTVGMYTTDIALTAEEATNFSREGTAYAAKLALAIMSAPSSYRARHIHAFSDSAGLEAAVSAWRAARAEK